MKELKLRGYVTPEDFEGTDGQRIQKALDLAKEADICKVVLRGEYNAEETIIIPAGIHLVLEGVKLYADLQNKAVNNFSFEADRIYIEGRGAEIVGNLYFWHTGHLVLENLKVEGNLRFAFARYPRVEDVALSGDFSMGRGCQHGIFQRISCKSLLISAEDQSEDIVGRYRAIKNIAFRDSEILEGASLIAAEDAELLNVQLDHLTLKNKGITVGKEGVELPKEKYLNLTFDANTSPCEINFLNEAFNAFVR